MSTALRCSRCSYDLQGIFGDARCPECGALVVHCVAPVRLRCWAPHQRVVLWATVCAALGLPMANVLIVHASTNPASSFHPIEALEIFMLVWLVAVIPTVVMLIIAAYHRRFRTACITLLAVLFGECVVGYLINAFFLMVTIAGV